MFLTFFSFVKFKELIIVNRFFKADFKNLYRLPLYNDYNQRSLYAVIWLTTFNNYVGDLMIIEDGPVQNGQKMRLVQFLFNFKEKKLFNNTANRIITFSINW